MIQRIEYGCVTIATAVATGTFHNMNDYLTGMLGVPVDKVGAFADIGAGAIAFMHWRHSRKGGHHA